jgi:hypothetical protein
VTKVANLLKDGAEFVSDRIKNTSLHIEEPQQAVACGPPIKVNHISVKPDSGLSLFARAVETLMSKAFRLRSGKLVRLKLLAKNLTDLSKGSFIEEYVKN